MVWGCVCVRKCFKIFLDIREKKIQLCQSKKILTETSHFVLKRNDSFSFAARGYKGGVLGLSYIFILHCTTRGEDAVQLLQATLKLHIILCNIFEGAMV